MFILYFDNATATHQVLFLHAIMDGLLRLLKALTYLSLLSSLVSLQYV